MRRLSILIVLVVLAAMLLFAAAGCEGRGLSSKQQPEEMLETILDASANMSSGTATIQADVQINLDLQELPRQDLEFARMFSGPINLSGTTAFSDKSQVVDLDMTAGAAGITINGGVRVVEEQLWVRLLGQWYELTEVMQESGYGADVGFWDEPYDVEEFEGLIADLGIEPMEWLGEVTLVGKETLGETAVYHLTCTPDVALIMNDAFLLLQDREFMTTLDPTGDLLDLLGSDFPTPAEFAEVEAMIPEMFQDLTVDIWGAKSDAIARKISAHVKVGPPPGEDTDGVESIEFTMTILLDDINRPVHVEAPEKYLPFSALEDFLGEGPGLMPFMGGGPGNDEPFDF
jgi:hypothetical protein